MNSEESVPTATPIVITREKSKIERPPSVTRDSSTSKVVPEVISVLLNVTLRA